MAWQVNFVYLFQPRLHTSGFVIVLSCKSIYAAFDGRGITSYVVSRQTCLLLW